MKQNDDRDKGVLEHVLKQWVVDAPLPPGFQNAVWDRIARAEVTPPSAPGFWALLARAVEMNLPRPKFAWAYVTILLLVGVLSGTLAAQRESTRMNAALGARYLKSIDPFHRSPSD
ncbi:MAG TPA: hypothetical protein VKY92_09090 [Verrucomicrobiae bacterium]|nr:hypothetical protein [Verrucomicrobiae bacterium]